MTGRTVLRHHIATQRSTINVTVLPAGMYFLIADEAAPGVIRTVIKR
jgi:hypothetical protein